MTTTAAAAIRTRSVQVPNGDLRIDAYLAEPTQDGTFPAVIVVQEIFGVNAHIREVTERFAKEGYVAIAPTLFQRTAPGFEVGYTPDDIQKGRGYKAKTKADELLSDIQATINYIKTLPNVNPAAIGSIGFCFGGHVVYLAATLPEIKVTASFYGGGIPAPIAEGDVPALARTAQIKGKVYAFFGDQDAGIPLSQVEQVEAALKAANIPHQVFRYAEAGHGFFCNLRESYNAAAAADAWEKIKGFFKAELS